ncbi:MAG: IS21 family transposase [Leptospirales bacterium]
MVQERLSMFKVLEVLEERYGKGEESVRRIARTVGISRPTVAKYLALAKELGICHWPLREESRDRERLRSALYPESRETTAQSGVLIPDWNEVEKELTQRKKSGVTRWLLWDEYRESHPEGLGYSQFCALYKEHLKNRDLRLHIPHAPGQELYVDYSGPKILIEPPGGKPQWVSLFVAVMGRSSYTFACATPDMKSASWIEGHRKTFEYMGGVPVVVIPDRPKTAIVSQCRVEPRLHRAFREMGRHYNVEVHAARSKKPRDKGSVENGVLNAQRSLMAPLRHRKFVSIEDLNAALLDQLAIFNRKPFQGRTDSRWTIFVEEDQPALGPLPADPFETQDWVKSTVHIDYHIDLGRFYYSVPYRLVGEVVDVRITARTVEIFYREERVASHPRNTNSRERFKTVRDHMPPHHKGYLDQSQELFLKQAAEVGSSVVAFFEKIFESRRYPPLAYRSCQGILSLRKSYPDRLNAACGRALALRSFSYATVLGILKNGMENGASVEPRSSPVAHENVRGTEYFAEAVETPPFITKKNKKEGGKKETNEEKGKSEKGKAATSPFSGEDTGTENTVCS